MSPNETPLAAAVGDASNVLLLASSTEAADRGCVDLLTDGRNLLCVALGDAPDDRSSVRRARADDEPPTRTGIIADGEATRTTATGSAADPMAPAPVGTIADPGDLTALGIRVSRYLDGWRHDDRPIDVCVHSLTALLEGASLREVYRFLSILTGQLEANGAVAHYHLDPAAHDRRTVGTLAPVFDVVVEPDGDGGWIATEGGVVDPRGSS